MTRSGARRWWLRSDSNRGLLPCKGSTLTAELRSRAAVVNSSRVGELPAISLLEMLRRLRRKRVLLLDDDPSMQRLVSALLKRGGYRVDTFLTGREAIAALERDGYDVLLLDLMMPHEGGNTVIKHLRANHPALLEHALPFTASPGAVLGALTKEVAGVVRKPFDSDE